MSTAIDHRCGAYGAVQPPRIAEGGAVVPESIPGFPRPADSPRLAVDDIAICLGYATRASLARLAAAEPGATPAHRIDALVHAGLLSDDQAERIRSIADGPAPALPDILGWLGVKANHIRAALLRTSATGESLAAVMADFGFLSPEKVARALALQSMRYPYLSRQEAETLDFSAIAAAGLRAERADGFVPVRIDPATGAVTLAVSHLDQIVAAANRHFRRLPSFVVAAPRTIRHLFERHFSRSEEDLARAEERLAESVRATDAESEQPGALRDYLGLLLRHACYARASDIHLHRTDAVGIVKLTVDGASAVFRVLPVALYERLVTRLTHYARVREDALRGDGLRDGSLELADADFGGDRELVDRYAFRIELGTAKSGRTAVIRILDREADSAELDALGFSSADRATLARYADAASGLVLITGPTGSGKTTTLYALLKEIDPERYSIQSIENPVEYRHGLWMQYEMKRGAGNEGAEWAKWLKGLLRNAPKVILMGEVRDGDTARTLLDGANTGHLVFTTLHTNSAASAVHRLVRLGVGREELADALMGVIAQRLVRRVCRRCAVADHRPETVAALVAAGMTGAAEGATVLRASPAGCAHCGASGYQGRVMLYEILDVNPRVRELIETGATASRLARDGIAAGRTLWEHGLVLVRDGVTTFDEVVKVAWRENPGGI
jgi:type II secretory ATPase GspE/PulE/Tfp pilus assembly ATPase PilB-like protein